MSKQKEKKLKKLKRQRILPYVIGIIIITVVFGMLYFGIAIFLITNVMMNKFQSAYSNTMKIESVISELWESGDTEKLSDTCDNIIDIMLEVDGVCIADTDKNILFQSGDCIPNWDYVENDLSFEGVNLILTDDEESIIYYNDKGFYFNIEYIEEFEQIAEEEPENMTMEEIYLGSLKLWFEVEKEDYSICIKNDMRIGASEITIAITIMVIMTILEAILVIYYLSSIISLVIERRKLAKILETDMVTGGHNLLFFNKKGKRILKRKKCNYAVIIMRLEKYRNYCSCYGVREGEELLEVIYNTMSKLVNKKEIVAHGDKSDFALLLAYTTEEELRQRLDHFIAHLCNTISRQKLEFSIGICKTESVDGNVETLFNYAGVAISVLTPDAEERVVLFTDEMRKEELWKRSVENDLDRAIANKEFMVYLQPKYSTKVETLSGAEALVRWNHPTEGFIAPYRFIPILEKNGSIIKLDDYMISEVARLQSEWIAMGKEVVPISVNVSRVHFAREDLAEHICRLVDQYNVPHHLVELELTESAFFDDKDALLNTINKLKDFGFEISMDDFGAGYSSLNSLKELPLDVLKLDAGFFREEDAEGRGKMIIGDTISLAKKLDMRIVAEGIETREQVDFLATLDCDLIQGYYFAKPMPVSDFEAKAFS